MISVALGRVLLMWFVVTFIGAYSWINGFSWGRMQQGFLLALLLLVLLLVLPGCSYFKAIEKADEIEGKLEALGAQVKALEAAIAELPEGPEKETALEALRVLAGEAESLQVELEQVQETMRPYDAGWKALGWVVGALVSAAGLARVRKYAGLTQFLCQKIATLEPDKQKRKNLIQPDALKRGYEGILQKQVKRAS